VSSDEQAATLARRVQDASDAARRLLGESAIVVEASRTARDDEHLPVCVRCGKIGVGGGWRHADDTPVFVLRSLEPRKAPALCPECFDEVSSSPRATVGHVFVSIHAVSREGAEALRAALSGYGVETLPGHVLEVDVGTTADGLTRALTAIGGCLRDHDLPPVHVRLPDRAYTLGRSRT
jgi:hypothetical protein